jgi:hypothetical protein
MASIKDSHVSSSEAAAILGLRPYGIQKLLRRGQLPGEKIANRWFIPRAAVEELAKTYVPRRGRPRRKRKYTRRSPKWNVK